MHVKKRDRILANQTAAAQKVYACVPISESWPAHKIMAQLKIDLGSSMSVAVVRGCLRALHESGLIRRPSSDLYIREPVVTAAAQPAQPAQPVQPAQPTEPAPPAQPEQPKESSMSASIVSLLRLANSLSTLAVEIEERLSEAAADIEKMARQLETETAAYREQLAKLKQLQTLLKDL
jgi:hypothetical protein